jgi:glycosyltransferase involved in cell wall biosynthesis
MRLSWYTPLSPVESGISLYNEELLPLLAKCFEIDVVLDGYRPTRLEESPGLRLHRRWRSGIGAAADGAFPVYQMGNSPAHCYMLPEIERNPGVLVLHDTMLHHLFVQHAARSGGWRWYQSLMAARYGEAGIQAASRVMRGQSPPSLFDFPLNEHLVGASRVTLVHSEHSRHETLSRCPDSRVERVPMGIRLPPVIDKRDARSALGLPHDQFVVASITHVNPHKRLDVVLRALARVRRKVPARMLVAGSVAPGVPLDRWIRHLGLGAVVDLHGYVPDSVARLFAAAADVIVNLRYPTAGETSASLLRSMAASRPVIVTEGGSFSELPDETTIKVPPDVLEEDMLVGILETLATRAGLGDEIGRNARAFVEREHSLPVMARRYVEILSDLAGEAVCVPDWSVADERISIPSSKVWGMQDPWIEQVGMAIAELGLGGNEKLLRAVAHAADDLGLRVGKINESIPDEQEGA